MMYELVRAQVLQAVEAHGAWFAWLVTIALVLAAADVLRVHRDVRRKLRAVMTVQEKARKVS